MSTERNHSRGSAAYLGMAAALLVASGGLFGGYVWTNAQVLPAVQEAEDTTEPADPTAVRAATESLLAREVTLVFGEATRALSWSELGLGLDEEALAGAAAEARTEDVLGSLQAAGALPVKLDRERALAVLKELAEQETPPTDARMDMEAHAIHPSRDGQSLDVYGSLGAIEAAAHLRPGEGRIELDTVAVPARVTVADLGIDDISHVLASFETKYAVNDASRNYNLKLAASKLNGYVLQPGQEFSFNDVVGARTEKEGYKIAHVITAGEMVDGLAGGTCQISTTLHGAAFFAGLGIDRALPHSRPSTYVTMGLDATVVYPHVDLKLKNNYDFPVAIHYKVANGVSTVEILGRERPYDKIEYERDIVEKLDFDTVTREDDTMPVGSMLVDQYGFYGYKVDKIRKYYKDGKVVKRDKWKIRYAPVTEYVRTGSNLDPNLAPPKPNREKRLKEPGDGVFRMAQ